MDPALILFFQIELKEVLQTLFHPNEQFLEILPVSIQFW